MNEQEVIYHLVPEPEFQALSRENLYTPAWFEQDGFIHCTAEPETLLAVANDYFRQSEVPVLVLVIDRKRINATVKFEPPAPVPGSGTSHLQDEYLFPHIYGPLNLDAIIKVGVLGRKAGGFCWPEDLENRHYSRFR